MAKLGFAHWLVWSAVLLVPFLVAFKSEAVSWAGFQVGLLPTYWPLWLFPLLITLNGFSPYLGSKTQTSFAMFSSLRAEDDRPNHFFLAGFPQIWDYQRDVVEIVRSENQVFEQLRPHSYLSRKWLRFRPFNAGPKMECRH